MRQYVIDFSRCGDELPVWDYIHQVFEFSDWFGKNLSAFWDLLTYEVPYPCKITIINLDKAPADWLDICEKIVKIVKRAHDLGWGLEYEVIG